MDKKKLVVLFYLLLLSLTACFGGKKNSREQDITKNPRSEDNQTTQVDSKQQENNKNISNYEEKVEEENKSSSEELNETDRVDESKSLAVEEQPHSDSAETESEDTFVNGDNVIKKADTDEAFEDSFLASSSLLPLTNILNAVKSLPAIYINVISSNNRQKIIKGRFSESFHLKLKLSGFYSAYEAGDGETLREILALSQFAKLQNVYSLLPQEGISFSVVADAGSFALKIRLSSQNETLLKSFANSLVARN